MANDIARQIEAVLAPLIGAVLAGVSLELESKRIGKTPDTLEVKDVVTFAANLEQQLRLVVGPEVAAKAARHVAAID